MNCEERYEDMIDHRSYTYNLSSCEINSSPSTYGHITKKVTSSQLA